MGYLAIILFVIIFILILRGYPVAFTLGGVSILFAIIVSVINPDLIRVSDFYILPFRFMGVVTNTMLMAVPLFIFMGIMLQRSKLSVQQW